MKKIKLFCFPHSGGSIHTYTSWKKYIDKDRIELHPIELPGRGKRFGEKFCATMEEAVSDVYQRISPFFKEGPFAFFGHSLGSLLACELAHKLIDKNNPNPVHIFFSGHVPNDIENKTCFSDARFEKFIKDYNLDKTTVLSIINHTLTDNKKCFTQSDIERIKESHPEVYRPLRIKCLLPSDLPDDEFAKESIEIREGNEEIFQHEELRKMLIPILKADHNLCNIYRWTPKPTKLQSDITALYGLEEEDITTPDIEHWKTHTEKTCRIIPFKGDHFYLEDKAREVVAIINHTLLSYSVKL